MLHLCLWLFQTILKIDFEGTWKGEISAYTLRLMQILKADQHAWWRRNKWGKHTTCNRLISSIRTLGNSITSLSQSQTRSVWTAHIQISTVSWRTHLHTGFSINQKGMSIQLKMAPVKNTERLTTAFFIGVVSTVVESIAPEAQWDANAVLAHPIIGKAAHISAAILFIRPIWTLGLAITNCWPHHTQCAIETLKVPWRTGCKTYVLILLNHLGLLSGIPMQRGAAGEWDCMKFNLKKLSSSLLMQVTNLSCIFKNSHCMEENKNRPTAHESQSKHNNRISFSSTVPS